MKQILKGLFIAVFGFLAAMWKTDGLPTTNLGWQVLGLSVLGIVIAHLAQSLLLKSTSKKGDFDLMDVLKGAFIAASTVLINIEVSNFTGTSIDFKVILASMGTVLIPYMMKQFLSTPSGIPPTK